MNAQLVIGLVWVVGQAMVFAQTPVGDAAALEAGLRAFGREEYANAKEMLERYAVTHTNQSAMLYFYQGECAYQMNNRSVAKGYFQRTFRTVFNKDEAADRLIMILEEDGESEKTQEVRQYRRERIKEFEYPASYDTRWSMTQPRGEPDKEDWRYGILGTGTHSFFSHGLSNLALGFPSGAAWHFEGGVLRDVPMNDRFSSEKALQHYQKLTKAYRQKAALFRSKTINVRGYDESQREEVRANQKKHMAEHGDQEAAQAEQLAEHYRLKAIVVEARMAAKKLKGAKPESP